MKESRRAETEDTVTDSAWSELWHTYGAYALGKNYNLLEKLGGVSWVLNMPDGKIKFDEHEDIGVQLLGSYMPAIKRWTWAWAEKNEYVPEEFTKAAVSMKELGDKYGIPRLASPNIKAPSASVNDIALLASGYLPSSGYFAADVGRKRKYLLLEERFLARDNTAPTYMARVFRDFVKMGINDHKRAFCSYAGMCGYDFTEKDGTVTAVKNNEVLMARFDREKLKSIQV